MKKGVSPVVVFLVIFFVLATGILLFIFKDKIFETSKDTTTIDLEIQQVYAQNENVLIDVKRNTGEGELVGIKFTLTDGRNVETIIKSSELGESEKQSFILNLTKLTAGKIKSISVSPVFKSSDGTEKTAHATDIYIGEVKSSSEEEITEPEECIPDCAGKTCGDNGCGRTCGTCTGTNSCINGVCVPQNCIPQSNAITCGTSVCGIKTNNCGLSVNCGSCTLGKICQQGSCVQQSLAGKWIFVLANDGIPMSEKSINFFCNSVSSNISAWLKRESDKYHETIEIPKIECLAEQIIFPEELVSKGIGVSGNIDLETVSFLESKYPSLEDAKVVTIITYLNEGPSTNHRLNDRYTFVYSTGSSWESYYLKNLYDSTVSAYSRTIAHEYMHILGASDKYNDSPDSACKINPLTGEEYDGYDIMCHRVLNENGGFDMPNLFDLIVTEPTAKEISWFP